MNEHAKLIWKAWADGKKVEYKEFEYDWSEWVDGEPISVPEEDQPQNRPHLWRIKTTGETKCLRYRCWVEQMRDGSLFVRAMQLNDDSIGEKNFRINMIETLPNFVCWDGPEREVIAEVKK